MHTSKNFEVYRDIDRMVTALCEKHSQKELAAMYLLESSLNMFVSINKEKYYWDEPKRKELFKAQPKRKAS